MLILLAMLQAQLPATVADPGVIATNQRVTPAGAQSVFTGRVNGVRFGQGASELWVSVPGSVYRMQWADNRVVSQLKISGTGGTYSLTRDPGSNAMLFSLVGRLPRHAVDSGKPIPAASYAQLAILAGDTLRSFGRLGVSAIGAPAAAGRRNAAGHRVGVVPLSADDRLAIIDIESGSQLFSVPLGVAPIAAVAARDGSIAWVSEMAGRPPRDADRSAKQCCEAKAEPVRIDARGIASEGAVIPVDLTTGQVGERIAVGRHPTAMVWDEGRGRLYVADGNSDQVTFVDTRKRRVEQVLDIAPFRMRGIGLAPTALALSPDAGTLFVALGGVNAVAMYDVHSNGPALLGMIPTGWYPSTLDVSPDGKYLAMGTLLGVGSGNGTTSGSPLKNGRFVHAVRGSVSVVAVPDAGRLASFTVAVSENNRLPLANSREIAVPHATVARAVPLQPGDPSLIRHVVYIIKENRTYDQILGDLPKGDGDSSLVIYGRDVTPNQHALADQFVVFDRFFASGGNSADGHQWLTQANETEYTLWPLYGGRSYSYDGTDPLAYSSGGFIWEAARAKGKSVAVFGEYAPTVRDSGAAARQAFMVAHRERAVSGATSPLPVFDTRSEIPSLDAVLARDYPAYSLAIPDVVRAEIFLKHLAAWSRGDSMPNLVMVQLPSNHTAGTTPEWCTPKACVADNDLAVGKIVEGLTHSPFWKEMAIIVVEDDAQNGVDHIDGHRTVALAISPYIRRGTVNSTFLNHPSLLRTIELMLGLPALSMFDLVASDLGASFMAPGEQPDFAPFRAIEPVQSIYERNVRVGLLKGAARSAAQSSSRMRFDIPDAAPADALNRILWHDARGWSTKYPGVRQSLFFPLSLDLTDEEREEAAERAANTRPVPLAHPPGTPHL